MLNKVRRDIDPSLSIYHFMMLIDLADSHPESITAVELAENYNVARMTITRGVQLMGKRVKDGKIVGPGYIENKQDLYETRRNAVCLTPAGVQYCKVLARMLAGEQEG